MNFTIEEPLSRRLARCESVEEQWLWCYMCQRFFHLSCADRSSFGGTAGCPFCGYPASFWDVHREPEDPRWPASTRALDLTRFESSRICPVRNSFCKCECVSSE